MKKVVYIVHCIDTEGPMDETLEASFQRLETLFGIVLPATKENLIKIQNKKIDFGKDTELIADVFSSKRINMKKTWTEIDCMLEEIRSKEYRQILPDSGGKGWKYSWFCMDHVGFTGNNPRHRDLGYHNVFDHYYNLLSQDNEGDVLQFHYHPLPFCGDCNLQGTSYIAGKNLFEILARDIIDRNFFPTAYRPGFHVERPDSHWFLEQWIPFDYGNQSVNCNTNNSKQNDTKNGRFGNWKNAPVEWYPYHPDYDDYRKKGHCRRYITRCLNMDARHSMLSEEDIAEAFEYADKNGSAILAFTNHDFRDMKQEIDRVRTLIANVAKKYPQVEFYYEDAVSAMKKILNMPQSEVEFGLELSYEKGIIKVRSNREIFGPQPFFAIRTITGNYYWDNLDWGDEENVWYYTLDEHTFLPEMIDTIGVAANDRCGNVSVKCMSLK